MRPLALSFGAAFALWAGSSAMAAVVVDNFTSGTTFLNLTAAAPPTQSASELEIGLSGVLGGSRSVTARKLNGLSGPTRNVTATVDSTNGEFAYISGNGVTGDLSLGYDANSAGLNVSIDPTLDKFLINFIAGDYSATRTIPVTMTLTAANNQSGTLTETLAVEVSPTTLEFNVADFSNVGGMDFSSNTLKSIQLDFNPTAISADFTLGVISIVPEPSLFAVTLAACAGVGIAIRRRRNRA